MISLNGYVLSDHLILSGIEQAAGVAINQRRTITGKSFIQLAVLYGGLELLLNSERHLTLDDVQAIKAIEGAGVPVSLVHPRGTFTVLVIDTSELIQDEDCVDIDASAWFSGNIKLIEV